MSDDFSLVATEMVADKVAGVDGGSQAPKPVSGVTDDAPAPQILPPMAVAKKTVLPADAIEVVAVKLAPDPPSLKLVAPEVEAKRLPEVEPEVEPSKPKKRGRPPKAQPAPKVPAWEPTEQDLKMIHDLAELGWPCGQIAEVMNLSTSAFAYAIASSPAIKEAYEAGVETGKNYAERRLAWRPLPADLERVRRYAAEGYRDVEIAAKMNVSRNAFTARMNDTPQLKAAYEQGEGDYRAEKMNHFERLIKSEDEALKYLNGPLSYLLKSRCEISDKPATQKVEVTGQVSHTVGLKAPDKVPVKDIAAFAAAEMARATAISAKNLAAVVPAEDVVDVEVSK